MLVNYGISIINNGYYSDDKTKDIQKLFLSEKFKYISKMVFQYKLLGFKHVRLPNMICPGNLENIKQILETDRSINKNRNMLKDIGMTLSIHTHYVCNNLTYKNLNNLLTYYKKLFLVMDFLGCKNFHIVQHVNLGSKHEILSVLKEVNNALGLKMSQLICLENSENGLDLYQLLEISKSTGNPIILDNFHNEINGKYELTPALIKELEKTWLYSSLMPKIHFSDGDIKTHRHGSTLDVEKLEYILNALKSSFDELIIQTELYYAKDLLADFRYANCNWNDGFSMKI